VTAHGEFLKIEFSRPLALSAKQSYAPSVLEQIGERLNYDERWYDPHHAAARRRQAKTGLIYSVGGIASTG
jgi:hypothetical protein